MFVFGFLMFWNGFQKAKADIYYLLGILFSLVGLIGTIFLLIVYFQPNF